MRIALVLYKDFPTGGLQRDARAVAARLVERGHQVVLLSREAEGPAPAGVERRLLPLPAGRNHARDLAFAAAWRPLVADCERLVGFDKLPGLDLYFAGDVCWKATRGSWRRLTARGRARLHLETAVFGPESATRILALTAAQRDSYALAHGTAPERFTLLPPLRDPAFRPGLARTEARRRLGLGESERVLLFIGRDARLKGFDRVLRALASLGAQAPRLLAVGAGTARFRRRAERLGLPVTWHPGGEDLAPCYAAADLLLHPARREAAGKVISEALGFGLPVLCTAACGYAPLVAASGAGAVLPEPFRQADLEAVLRRMPLAAWRRKAAAMAFPEDGIDAAVAAIERSALSWGRERRPEGAGEGLVPDGQAPGSPHPPRLRSTPSPPGEGWMTWALQAQGKLHRQAPGRETLEIPQGFLKRHHGVGWREIVKNWLLLKRPIVDAGNEWRALRRLEALGLGAPKALAWGSRGRNPARRQSFVLMRRLEGEPLEDLARAGLPPAERRRLATAAGDFVRRLHAAGIAHRDLYLCHFYRQPDGSLAVLDLHRALQARRPGEHWLAERWRAKDLAALLASTRPYGLRRSEVFLFLAAYHALPLAVARRRFARLWAAVERRAARLQARASG